MDEPEPISISIDDIEVEVDIDIDDVAVPVAIDIVELISMSISIFMLAQYSSVVRDCEKKRFQGSATLEDGKVETLKTIQNTQTGL